MSSSMSYCNFSLHNFCTKLDNSCGTHTVGTGFSTERKGTCPKMGQINKIASHLEYVPPCIHGIIPCGPFTLLETETETDIENKYTERNGNLCCHLSLCNVNTTQSYTTYFLSVSVSGSVNTP